MQEIFPKDEAQAQAFRKSLGEARLARYLTASGDDTRKAIALYAWNANLSKSLYFRIQAWEICLRNRMNGFLCWKFNGAWPYDEKRAVRQLNSRDAARLSEARLKQERERRVPQATTDAIVAELSAGFWVSLLTAGYDAKFVWRYNLARVFPNADKAWQRPQAHDDCDLLLTVRNRVAHHEPVFQLDLTEIAETSNRVLANLCSASHAYMAANCNLAKVISADPRRPA